MTEDRVFLLIIWSSAMEWKDTVLDDLRREFKVLRIFRVTWDEGMFLRNLKVFYSHSQCQLPSPSYEAMLRGKMNHCGTGDFLAVVFEDPCPDYQWRDTSGGKRMVNAHVFDRKMEYRSLSGGGHRIHTSDTARETNKDLTALFGLNTKDFLGTYPTGSAHVTPIARNCTGVDGYRSLEEFFYVMNNSVDYCVLRNFDCLPEAYTMEGHGDIDLLVENRNHAVRLTSAKQVFPEPWRVYYTVSIAGEEIPFDFRHVGDDYYDGLWEQRILGSRKLERGLFYVPDNADLFYSLLYHAYVQKREVKDDYLAVLRSYAGSLGVSFDGSEDSAVALLDGFMRLNGYEYCRPKDDSVIYNEKFLGRSSHAFRYGSFVKRTVETGSNGYAYTVSVYDRGDAFVKVGSGWLLENERQCLERMEGDAHFPSVISFSGAQDDAVLVMSAAPGTVSSEFFRRPDHQKRSFVRSFVKEAWTIVKGLKARGLCHRDIQPSNLIVDGTGGRCRVSLIDFGWACDAGAVGAAPAPAGLNLPYRAPGDCSDSYSFGKVVEEFWPELPYARRVSRRFCSGRTPGMVLFTVYDSLRLFLRRHRRAAEMKDRLARLFRA